jgi:hypothetical protein
MRKPAKQAPGGLLVLWREPAFAGLSQLFLAQGGLRERPFNRNLFRIILKMFDVKHFGPVVAKNLTRPWTKLPRSIL